MASLLKATRSAAKATQVIPAIARQTFATSSPGPRWPSSMDDLPTRSRYGAKVVSQTLPMPDQLQSEAGKYDLSVERKHPGCEQMESQQGAGVEGKRQWKLCEA
ncbi:hypothetical protein FKW77_000553 [Venturia effusa]|uniref:Uncharacterized protein n=1 Tax=Venturia effusa TaxID=50376 RepID=A0A517L0N8_9PEZI|nr:hypothetical protein FKW77_000553 [Venturia effusa]